MEENEVEESQADTPSVISDGRTIDAQQSGEEPQVPSAAPVTASKRKKVVALSVPILLVVVLVGLVVFLRLNRPVSESTPEMTGTPTQSTSRPEENQQTTPSETALETKVRENDVLLKLGVGYQVALDKSWDVKIVESGKQHNFLTAGVSSSGIRIEVEAFSHSLPNWEKYLKNGLYKIENVETKKINANTVKIETGKEAFAQSNARLVIGTWDSQDKTLVVRVIGNDQSSVNAMFEQLSSSVSTGTAQKTSFKFVQEVLAAEDFVPSSLPRMEYKQVEVMAEPIEDTITNKDTPYKDGFAKGYKFVAFKSQRLTTIALEKDSPPSYVASQIFDSDGNEVDIERDTRIEFKVPHTGVYYYIVRTRNNREGKILVGVDDRGQSQSKIYIKYPDGAELYVDSDEPLSFLVGSFDIGLIIQIPKPVSVLANNTIEYEYVVPEFGPNVGLFRSALECYMAPDTYKARGLTATSTVDSIEDPGYRTEIDILQLGANRILITPKDGLFPKNHHIVIVEKIIHTPNPEITQGYGGVGVFTQDKKPVTIPILKQLYQDFPDKFWKMIESYFSWSMGQGSPLTEVEGGWLEAKLWNDNTLTFFQDYLVGKGYTVDELNSNGQTVGLAKGSTVCKIHKGSCNNDICGSGIYCGNLP